jgi:hypothetical protein
MISIVEHEAKKEICNCGKHSNQWFLGEVEADRTVVILYLGFCRFGAGNMYISSWNPQFSMFWHINLGMTLPPLGFSFRYSDWEGKEIQTVRELFGPSNKFLNRAEVNELPKQYHKTLLSVVNFIVDNDSRLQGIFYSAKMQAVN